MAKPFIEPISLAKPSALDVKQTRELEQVGRAGRRRQSVQEALPARAALRRRRCHRLAPRSALQTAAPGRGAPAQLLHDQGLYESQEEAELREIVLGRLDSIVKVRSWVCCGAQAPAAAPARRRHGAHWASPPNLRPTGLDPRRGGAAGAPCGRCQCQDLHLWLLPPRCARAAAWLALLAGRGDGQGVCETVGTVPGLVGAAVHRHGMADRGRGRWVQHVGATAECRGSPLPATAPPRPQACTARGQISTRCVWGHRTPRGRTIFSGRSRTACRCGGRARVPCLQKRVHSRLPACLCVAAPLLRSGPPREPSPPPPPRRRRTALQAILAQLPDVEGLRAVTGAYVPVMEMKVGAGLGAAAWVSSG